MVLTKICKLTANILSVSSTPNNLVADIFLKCSNIGNILLDYKSVTRSLIFIENVAAHIAQYTYCSSREKVFYTGIAH